MRISTAPTTLPLIVEDADGVDVVCRACNDRQFLQLINGAATVVAIAPQSTTLTSAERDLIEIVKAYWSGALTPEACWNDIGEAGEDHDRRLAPARKALEQHRRWLIAGRAERPRPHGMESVAVVALIGEPHATCIVRLRLDDDGDAATSRAA